MTPTLFGRWQTRLFLLATVGTLVTLPFYLGLINSKPSSIYFWVLGYVALFGIGWDMLYIYLQHFRWDRDWPGAFQFIAGIWEAIFVAVLITIIGLPGIPKEDFDLGAFALHYSLVWLVIYLASQTVMRILFPYWRFRGGQLF
jgi:predicted permease